jgi:RHS repeat-associated protein
MMKGGSTKSYYSRNQQFSITALTDATGNVTERYAYDAHGNTIIMSPTGAMRSNSSLGNPFAFTGRFLHTGVDLMYFRARYYDTSTGEFISRDPLEYVDGMSLYREHFVPSSVDPFGLRVECPTTKNECGNTWVEVTRPEDNMSELGEWKWTNNWYWQHSFGYYRTRIDHEWIRAEGVSNVTSGCSQSITFEIGTNAGKSTTISVGGELGFEKGGVNGGITGTYEKGWDLSVGLAGTQGPYQEEDYAFTAVPLVEKTDLWWDWRYRGADPVTKKLIWVNYYRNNRPFWTGNTLYTDTGILVCKRKCCPCKDDKKKPAGRSPESKGK